MIAILCHHFAARAARDAIQVKRRVSIDIRPRDAAFVIISEDASIKTFDAARSRQRHAARKYAKKRGAQDAPRRELRKAARRYYAQPPRKPKNARKEVRADNEEQRYYILRYTYIELLC